MEDEQVLSYSQLLKKYIKESGLTLEEISRRCRDIGVKIHPTYISKLRLGKRPPPSDEITEAIAKVINGNEYKLVTAGLIEKLPEGSRKQMADSLFHLDSVSESIDRALHQQILFDLSEGEETFEFSLRIIYAFAIRSSLQVNRKELVDLESIKKLVFSKLESHDKAELLSLLVNVLGGDHMGELPESDSIEFEEMLNGGIITYEEIIAKQEAYVSEVERKLLDKTKDDEIQKANEFFDRFLIRTNKLPDDEKELVASMIELVLKKYGL